MAIPTTLSIFCTCKRQVLFLMRPWRPIIKSYSFHGTCSFHLIQVIFFYSDQDQVTTHVHTYMVTFNLTFMLVFDVLSNMSNNDHAVSHIAPSVNLI